ncbi:translation initiation factor IF-2 (plasmid) [Erwinia tracheiphila]|uniref:Gp138 family membrane-puncturing spike protein n=1 Tax=Erwinia tracheiphila TaxID=65700 RepID=UPI001F1B073B|nr:Gp138 family membrane-puncturing spike protein [Erwinia tracheiphila]UIA94537.1 translation initiation factor IF-2 [Erwinia tracheiphila]
MDRRERYNDPEEALRVALRAERAGIWTSLPGIVQSFDPVAVTVVVQPAIKGRIMQKDGSWQSVNMPLLVDVPVCFPRGGGTTLTFPVNAGDECMVVFADRCIDAWWQSGGIQEPMEPRMHDLSDGFAFIGPMSQAKKIGGISTSTVQLRSDDGAALIELDPASHAVNVKTSGKLTASASGGTEITSPEIVLNGNVTINGNFSQGMGEGGGAATLLGPVSVTNDVTASGVSVKNHRHGGVETGSGDTGGPK